MWSYSSRLLEKAALHPAALFMTRRKSRLPAREHRSSATLSLVAIEAFVHLLPRLERRRSFGSDMHLGAGARVAP